jgi:hypothetical protein
MQRKEVTQMHAAILRGLPALSAGVTIVAVLAAMALAPIIAIDLIGPVLEPGATMPPVCPPDC